MAPLENWVKLSNLRESHQQPSKREPNHPAEPLVWLSVWIGPGYTGCMSRLSQEALKLLLPGAVVWPWLSSSFNLGAHHTPFCSVLLSSSTNLQAPGAGQVVDGSPDPPVDQHPGLELFIQACDVFVNVPALLSETQRPSSGVCLPDSWRNYSWQ